MPTLPDFRLETHFSKWEFKARYHLTASDAESLSLRDLLDGASAEERASLDDLWLGYTCLLYTSPSPRDQRGSRMPSSA